MPKPILIATLRLVYPPVSNQEAEWVKHDPEVQARLRGSDFYLIAIRREVSFGDGDLTEDGLYSVPVNMGDGRRDTVEINALQLAYEMRGDIPINVGIATGPKVVHILEMPDDSDDQDGADHQSHAYENAGSHDCAAARDAVRADPFAYDADVDEDADDTAEVSRENSIEWFTTEKLIYDRSRDMSGLSGLDSVRDFATYELLYVGIAKVTDTFERLFDGAHEARQRILSSEWPRRNGSRVTDEMVLFAFRVEPMVIRTLEVGDQPSSFAADEWHRLHKRVVADAEKAFVHLLDPSYNIVKFANYPKGDDGLWEQGYDRYGFVLIENFTFTTASETLRGAGDSRFGMVGQDADMLFTSGAQTAIWSPPRATSHASGRRSP